MGGFRLGKPWEDLKPYNVRYIENPSQKELRELTLRHISTAFVSAYGNIDRITKRKARMQKYTYIIAPQEVSPFRLFIPKKRQMLLECSKYLCFLEKG